ncbi:exodeoxyribonuclease V subunit gamma, partial [Stutzerimonas nitrititolerans]|uniref:exodeoxyribonuclease V subunit gamma n=1 Tax=Stutzerimonas nitrititolerans TaxID=2482751 RepID=UPI0028A12C0A
MRDEQTLTPGMMVVHGNRLEELRELAVAWMQRHPLAPLENEVVLVQSNGIAQWLKLALAEQSGCGIAAAIQLELPARFLWQSYRAVLGSDEIPQQSPLDKAPLTWRLVRLLPALLQDQAFAPLRRFLADDADLRKRHQLAERRQVDADLEALEVEHQHVGRLLRQHGKGLLGAIGHAQGVEQSGAGLLERAAALPGRIDEQAAASL